MGTVYRKRKGEIFAGIDELRATLSHPSCGTLQKETNIMPIKLFISKSIEEVDNLRLFCKQKGWSLVARSFLTFEPKVFKWDGEEDVIFFSSPRAVDFFEAQHSLPKSKTYACAGEKTGEKLMANG